MKEVFEREHRKKKRIEEYHKKKCVNDWLVVWVLWHIKLCRLFNAKSIFM